MPELAAYDNAWRARFGTEAPVLEVALAPVIAVEHVGSTSVPGLAAKPTIDIAVGVASLALTDITHNRMKAVGYHYGGDHGLRQHVFRKGEALPWEILVHVVEHEGAMWHDFLRFREHLRANPADAARYEALKRSLLVGRRDWYHGVDKAAFITPILRQPTSSVG